MTKQQIMTAMQELPTDLKQKLVTAPQGISTADFSDDEQAALEDSFGSEWRATLGIAE